ncbi:MAG: 2-C-methyl-D-erythritol 2,4-cyclodiphosphate synthase [Planctomycetota bacterium]|nr:2-C-methyl-D-erythritol 2,4-cyclodiphosphate synthase [Planctomycetota bacterium]
MDAPMRYRIGFGTDLHRLRKGEGIRLGGMTIPCGLSCDADSDGDVLVHALVDALLGSLALGDIGERFPADKVRRGEDSRVFLAQARSLVLAAGARVINVDSVIHLEQPNLKNWKNGIRRSLAEVLDLPPANIGVKAKTAEGLGPIGEGLAVGAQAAVLVELDEDA